MDSWIILWRVWCLVCCLGNASRWLAMDVIESDFLTPRHNTYKRTQRMQRSFDTSRIESSWILPFTKKVDNTTSIGYEAELHQSSSLYPPYFSSAWVPCCNPRVATYRSHHKVYLTLPLSASFQRSFLLLLRHTTKITNQTVCADSKLWCENVMLGFNICNLCYICLGS